MSSSLGGGGGGRSATRAGFGIHRGVHIRVHDVGGRTPSRAGSAAVKNHWEKIRGWSQAGYSIKLKTCTRLLSTNRNRACRPIAKRALGSPRHPNSIPIDTPTP
ncbi:hypothetical protein TNCV_4746771 [Trichonephila clavipes]|nr:hypothetical protein TNCV_4746771 [Trichonephila clavipes]